VKSALLDKNKCSIIIKIAGVCHYLYVILKPPAERTRLD
jgi:hypothetical protein